MSMTLKSVKKITELKQHLLTQAEAEYAELKQKEAEALEMLEQMYQERERCRKLIDECWQETAPVSRILEWEPYLNRLTEQIKTQEAKTHALSLEKQKKFEVLKSYHMEERKWESYLEKRQKEQSLAMRILEQKVLDDLAITNYRSHLKRG
jgi:flagellar protein FliJ